MRQGDFAAADFSGSHRDAPPSLWLTHVLIRPTSAPHSVCSSYQVLPSRCLAAIFPVHVQSLARLNSSTSLEVLKDAAGSSHIRPISAVAPD